MTPKALTPDHSTSEDQLVRAHLHLASQAVHELARRLPSHVNRDDLSSAAMLGLAQAARSWDPARGRASSATPPPGTGSTPTWTRTPSRPSPGPTAAWPSAGPPTTRPSPPAPTSGPGSTRRRGRCSNVPPRPVRRRLHSPESPFRQRIRLIRSWLHNISESDPEPPRLAPFQTVCSVRTMARTVGG
jgi:hypothetical protein